MPKTTPKPAAKKKTLPLPVLNDMLGFFFPIHYRIGMELETRMCQGRISRQQAAIIWLIESEVGGDGWIRRRVIL